MAVLIGAIENYLKTHKSLLRYLNSIKKVHSVSELLEMPNKHGNNLSYFTVKYDVKDKFNYKRIDFNIEYDRKIIFVSNEGYFPYKNIAEIRKIVSKFIK